MAGAFVLAMQTQGWLEVEPQGGGSSTRTGGAECTEDLGAAWSQGLGG